jgi:hypothetical protein
LDWHSAVHSHWALCRLANRGFLSANRVAEDIGENLSPENLHVEREYFLKPNRQGFERTYGWAWLLTLAAELCESESFLALSRNLAPLESLLRDMLLDYLSTATLSNRTGLHNNTAFSLALALDYSQYRHDFELKSVIATTVSRLYQTGERLGIEREPEPTDFLSPSLTLADLYSRLMDQEAFCGWFASAFDGFDFVRFQPIANIDHADGYGSHLDGLNLSRAWCMRRVATRLGVAHTQHQALIRCSVQHKNAGLSHVLSGHYAGEHWLPTFAVYLLTSSA